MRTTLHRNCIGSVPCSGVYGRTATRGAGATPRRLRRVAATTQTVDPVEHLQGKDLESWETCRKVLEEQWGLTDQEAQKTLVRAFGWGKQNYWRNEKVEEVPTLQQLESVQGFMEGLGIPQDVFVTLVKKFPELVGHSVEERLQPNAKELETSWFMKGKILANTVKRRPQVLGFNMNCEGNCKGECSRCWVHF